MYKKIFLFFFVIFYSCSSNYIIYEKKGFAKIVNNDKIITSFPKGTIFRITNVEIKESIVVTTNEKSKNLGSRVITLPNDIFRKLKLDKNLPLIHMQSLRKNKIYIAKKTKTFEQEKRVDKKIKIEKINVMNLSEKKKIKDKIYLNFGPFYNKTYANQMYKVLNFKINNKNLIFKDYKDNNYKISVGPLNNLKEYDKIYLKLGKIGLIGFDINIQ
tara:strand:- start:8835 stop:9479 length:645 start_codon:yes stop_codon:yes gene_type:complete